MIKFIKKIITGMNEKKEEMLRRIMASNEKIYRAITIIEAEKDPEKKRKLRIYGDYKEIMKSAKELISGQSLLLSIYLEISRKDKRLQKKVEKIVIELKKVGSGLKNE